MSNKRVWCVSVDCEKDRKRKRERERARRYIPNKLKLKKNSPVKKKIDNKVTFTL